MTQTGTTLSARALLGFTVGLVVLNVIGLLLTVATGQVVFMVPCAGISLGALGFLLRRPLEARGTVVYLFVLVFFVFLSTLLGAFYPSYAYGWRPIWVYSATAVMASIAVLGLMEYGILRLFGLLRLGAVVRVTYYEALLQPFTLIVMGLTIAAIIVFTFVPYYTFNDDNKMYRDVATQFGIVAALIIMVFSSAKAVDEEIENRTMLTLMSKPISRWQVILGKYLGIVCIVFTVLAVLDVATTTTSFLHWFDDKRLDYAISSGPQADLLTLQLHKIMLSLIPLFVLQFLQVITLAAIAVAISTRYSLALNVTVIALVYVLTNMTVYIPGLGLPQPWKGLAVYGSYLLPYLANFDISQRLIYGDFTLGHQEFINATGLGVPSYEDIWQYTGVAGVYALLYIGAALSAAITLFRTRELT